MNTLEIDIELGGGATERTWLILLSASLEGAIDQQTPAKVVTSRAANEATSAPADPELRAYSTRDTFCIAILPYPSISSMPLCLYCLWESVDTRLRAGDNNNV